MLVVAHVVAGSCWIVQIHFLGGCNKRCPTRFLFYYYIYLGQFDGICVGIVKLSVAIVVGSVLAMQSAMPHIMDRSCMCTFDRQYHCFFNCCTIHLQRSGQMLQVLSSFSDFFIFYLQKLPIVCFALVYFREFNQANDWFLFQFHINLLFPLPLNQTVCILCILLTSNNIGKLDSCSELNGPKCT